MLAPLLEFKTRAGYDDAKWQARQADVDRATPNVTTEPVTSIEKTYTIYFTQTQAICKRLVSFFKSTGVWTTECETIMIEVVQKLQALCMLLATNTVNHKTSHLIKTEETTV